MNAMTMRVVRINGELRHVPAPLTPAPAKGKKVRPTPDPIVTNPGDTTAAQLRQFIERIETVEEEIRGLADDKKDIFTEAKSTGFDMKAMRAILKLRQMEKHHRDENDALIETYRSALGLL